MKMATRLIKSTELEFLNAYKHELYSKGSDISKSWKVGENLVFVVGDEIAGFANVLGRSYHSDEELWPGVTKPFRLPIDFIRVFPVGDRPTFSGSVHKNMLIEIYGKNNWGHVFVNKHSLPDHVSKSLLTELKGLRNMSEKVDFSLDISISNEIKSITEKIQRKAKQSMNQDKVDYEEKRETLVFRMLEFVRNDPERLEKLKHKSFLKSLDESENNYFREVKYADVKHDVKELMSIQGLFRPKWKEYGPGTYVVVGDSHGDHAEAGVFSLVQSLSEYIGADNVFHIGHILDDNEIINEDLVRIKDLVVISRVEESPQIEEFYEDNSTGDTEPFEIIQEGVLLGNVKVANHDLSNDYMSTRADSKTVNRKVFEESSILSGHRHEISNTATNDDQRVVSGFPGCLCENHVSSNSRKPRYRQDILEKFLKKNPWHLKANRRRITIKEEWEQGVFVVNVSADYSHTIVPCRIKKVMIEGRERFATSYFDKIISENAVHEPDKKIFVNGDVHAPLQDSQVLHIQDQVVKDYQPDIYVNIGDIRSSEGLNHHILDRGEIPNETLIEESTCVYHLLKMMSEWAPEKHVLFGNHERFACDFIKKNPQFEGLIDFNFMCGVERLGYNLVPHQGTLEIDDVVFVHGDILRGGAAAMDKYASAFPDKTVVLGHSHYPAIRSEVYMMGLTGLRDQGYNEKSITRWCHGLGFVNTFNGVSWATSIAIERHSISINGKKYSSDDDGFWRTYRYKTELVYIPEDPESELDDELALE
jgi:hypothetical protein